MFFDCDARIFNCDAGKDPGYLAANVTVRGDYRFK